MDINERREALWKMLIGFMRDETELPRLLHELHALGLVFKVEGELPLNPYQDESENDWPNIHGLVGREIGYNKAKSDMAGYTKTAPIKEITNV